MESNKKPCHWSLRWARGTKKEGALLRAEAVSAEAWQPPASTHLDKQIDFRRPPRGWGLPRRPDCVGAPRKSATFLLCVEVITVDRGYPQLRLTLTSEESP